MKNYPFLKCILVAIFFTLVQKICLSQRVKALDSIDIKIINEVHSGKFTTAKQQLDSILKFPNKLSSYYLILFKSRLGLFHTIRNNQDSSLNTLLPLFESLKSTKYYELQGDIASYIGRAYQHKNDHANAYRFFNESMQAHKRNNFENYFGTSNCFLGYFLLNSNMLDLAKETMEQGLYYARRDTHSIEYEALKTLNILISIRKNIEINNLLLARSNLNMLVNSINKTNNRQDEATYWIYKGDIDFLEHNYPTALSDFQNAKIIAEKYQLEYESAEAVIGISKSLSKLNNQNDALLNIQPLLSKHIVYPYFISSSIYHELYQLYKFQGNTNKALFYSEKYVATTDSVHQNEIAIFVLHSEIIKNEFNHDKLVHLNNYTKEQLQKQNIIKYALIIISMLLLSLIVLSYVALKSRQKNIQRLYKNSVELEALNKEIELKNWSLANMNKKLIENNESLQNFAYTAAHDLKGPLTGIFTYLQLIRHKSSNYSLLPDYIKIFTEKGLAEASRLNTLIQDLLSLSNIDKNLPAPKTVLLTPLIKHILEIHHAFIKEHHAYVTIDSHLPPINGHQNMMESLFQNLIINAIKYKHPDRYPRIKISHHCNANYLHIYVCDNGLGIEKSMYKEIFKPFKRISTEIDGTGLGLNTCKKIVEYYHGKLVVQSSIDKGSTFCIILPIEMIVV